MPFRERLLHLGQRRTHLLRHVERVGARLLVHRDDGGGLALEPAADRIVLLAQLGAADVLEAHDGRIAAGRTNDDVVEFRRVSQPPGRRDGERLLDRRAGRRLAEAPHRELLVLVGDRPLHVPRRDAELRHAIGLEPDTHRVVRRAEDSRLIRAGNALERIEHVDIRVVGDIGRVVAVARRIDRDHHHERRRLLLHLNALRLHRRRQLRQREVHAVLHVDLRQFRIGADLEERVERQIAGR